MGHWSKKWKNTTWLIKEPKYIYTHYRNFLNISRNGRKIWKVLTRKEWGSGQLEVDVFVYSLYSLITLESNIVTCFLSF